MRLQRRKKFRSNFTNKKLEIALSYLSRYVGTIYPGKNSLIAEISIFRNDLNMDSNISICSNLIDKRLSIIDNQLIYKNYYIEF